jgi:glycosyltransferase involved in cell wall biosynthesis
MLILIGPLPPPVHGQAVVTKRVMQMLGADKASTTIRNTAPRFRARGLPYHLSRIWAYLLCCRTVLTLRKENPSIVYLSLSGRLGLIYDLVVVVVSRLRRYNVVFHHHSFAYLTRPNRIMRAIVWIAGASQRHIVLCPTMALKLVEHYGTRPNVEIISNLVFLDTSSPTLPYRGRPLTTIGFLSNISFEKGIDRYLDLLAALKKRGSAIRGIIAGPFDNETVQSYTEQRMNEIGTLTYLGPVYGDLKTSFFSLIDLLVFPTRYSHEAEPLVVYEARAAGIPVVASTRGCLAEMAVPGTSSLLDSTASNLEPLIEQILTWERCPNTFDELTQRHRRDFAILLDQRTTDAARFRALFSTCR